MFSNESLDPFLLPVIQILSSEFLQQSKSQQTVQF